MKVLQILPSLEVGGVERGVIDLVRDLKKNGISSVVVSSGGQLVEELKKIGAVHYEMPVHKKTIFSLGLVSKLAEIIQREGIDIVHARSRVPAWIAWFAARKAGVPFVTTCHGYYSTHLLSHIMGWGKRVIVISRIIGRHMIDDFGVSPERIRLIYRGVDLSQFQNHAGKNSKTNQKIKTIINVGRLSPIKGQIEFLKAIHILKSQMPNIQVWLVGSEGKGQTKYTNSILHTIDQLGLTHTVKLLGTRRDVPELMAQSDLLVLSTLVPEAFGRVVIEAAAVGTPVLATKVGGVLEIIDESENGWLVPAGDVQAMSVQMLEILKNPEASCQAARKLQKKVSEHFSLEKMTQKTVEVYHEVLKEKKILVIKLGAVGDVILSIPSLRMIRERFPDASISLLVDKKISPIISSTPYVNDVIPVDRKKMSHSLYLLKVAKRIRKEGFDISVDLQNSKWTHVLAKLAGIRERFGFARGLFGFLLNRPDRSSGIIESPVKNQFRILSHLGVLKYDESLELWTDLESEKKINYYLPHDQTHGPFKNIGIVLGASPKWQTKRWPIEHIVELSKRLLQNSHYRVVLIGTDEDKSLLSAFPQELLGKAVNLVGKTTLQDIVSLVKRLDVIVTGDTAPLHVASAMKTKIIALFGPTDPKRHMPPAASAVVLNKNFPCQPCYQGVCKNADALVCMKKISVNEVYEAVQRQLSYAKKMQSQPVSIPT